MCSAALGTPAEDPNELFEQAAVGGAEGSGAVVIGTPDDLIEAIPGLQEVTGGFGTALGFANDWANNEANVMRSWDLVALRDPCCQRSPLHAARAPLSTWVRARPS
ncbi:MAG: hypothetical protein IPL07_05460 [Acidimicrobiaceae bacterium]|nr:hypothetical protein [Acidimicrobiaceae bacterium]